jgi:hypothetical protein
MRKRQVMSHVSPRIRKWLGAVSSLVFVAGYAGGCFVACRAKEEVAHVRDAGAREDAAGRFVDATPGVVDGDAGRAPLDDLGNNASADVDAGSSANLDDIVLSVSELGAKVLGGRSESEIRMLSGFERQAGGIVLRTCGHLPKFSGMRYEASYLPEKRVAEVEVVPRRQGGIRPSDSPLTYIVRFPAKKPPILLPRTEYAARECGLSW